MSTDVSNLIAKYLPSGKKATKAQMLEALEAMAYDWKQDGAEMMMMQGRIELLEDEIKALQAEINTLMQQEGAPKTPGGTIFPREVHEVLVSRGFDFKESNHTYFKRYPDSTTQHKAKIGLGRFFKKHKLTDRVVVQTQSTGSIKIRVKV